MASKKPVIHGSDHLPGHSDPIPGMGSGGGIQFDTYPQSGGWLYVESTNDTGAPTAGGGIQLKAADNIYLTTINGGLYVNTNPSGGDIDLNAGADVVVNGTNIGMFASDDITIGGDTLSVGASVGELQLRVASTSGNDVVVTMGGAAVLRVSPNGLGGVSYHIKSGGSWVADL